MKRVVSISLGTAQRDYHCVVTVLGQRVDIERIGTNGDIAQAAQMVRDYDGHVDAIGLGGLTTMFRVGNARYPHRQALAIARQARRTPVVDGSVIKATLEHAAVQRVANELPALVRHRRVVLTSGLDRYPLAQALAQHSADLRFADPLVHFDLPFLPTLRSPQQLERYVATMLPILALLPHRVLQPAAQADDTGDKRAERLLAWADLYVGDCTYICRHSPPDLQQRSIITDDPSPKEIYDLRQRGLATLITMTPPLSDERPFVSADVLEAIVTAILESSRPPDETETRDFTAAAQWEPTIQQLNPPPQPKFAFVLPSLRTTPRADNPRWSRLTRLLPPLLTERVAAQLPPRYLSRIRGVRSQATGKEVEGLLFSLGVTPREMLRRPASFTERRWLRAAQMAERRGAKLIGLAAFATALGDVGVVVANKSVLGIVTGNALAAVATLETAKHAARLMHRERPDAQRAVVIGAAGSGSAVVAQLLAQAHYEVVLVTPHPDRHLAKQHEPETLDVPIRVATLADADVGTADLMVIVSDTLGGQGIPIGELKPGAVVCDSATPPAISAAAAASRPDVLVVEQSAIVLPGKPNFGFNTGLTPGTADACLSEVALLAMEGTWDTYTMGHDLNVAQVEHMRRLMHKHGLRLAGLRSFGRSVTNKAIAERQRLAEQRQQQIDAAGQMVV